MDTDLIGECGSVLDKSDAEPLFEGVIRGVYLDGRDITLIVQTLDNKLLSCPLDEFQLED